MAAALRMREKGLRTASDVVLESALPDISLDLRYLRCVVAAAETGSFRQASELLELPQSSISRRVQLLEHRLGFSLFRRTRLGVSLTDAGHTFLEGALIGAEQFALAARAAAAIHRGHPAELKIGVSPSRTASLLFRETMRRFRSQFTSCKITIVEADTIQLRRSLALGGIDIAFLITPKALHGFEIQELWQEAVYVALPAGHRLVTHRRVMWSDLTHETLIVPNRGKEIDKDQCLVARLTGNMTDIRIEEHQVSEASSFDLIAWGYGVTLAHEATARRKISGIVFRRLSEKPNSLMMSAVWKDKALTPYAVDFIAVAASLGRGKMPNTAGECTKTI
ncbi:LysR family transcriptional regulator [Sphingomonas guangdongensis]|nr:LysR family transcriptional regulator [Sphingomonas guangdongensis]